MLSPRETTPPARIRIGRIALLLAALAVWVALAPAAAVAATGAPTSLTAAASPTAAKPVLTWVAPVAVGAGLAGYNVYRGATKANTTLLSAAALSFTDSGLAADGSYSYTVRAVETGSGIETASSAVTVVYDHTAPLSPGGFAAPTPTNSAPVLSWSAAADATSGIAGYQVYRGLTLLATTTATTYTDGAVTTSGNYAYSVKAVDNSGNVSAAATFSVTFDVVAPTVPAGFSPAANQSAKPYLAWTAATDSGGSGVQGYNVYRNGTLVGTTTTTNFSDAGVIAEGTYSYAVVAVDKAGNASAPTPTKAVTYDVTAPTSASAVTAVATPTNVKPSLSWTGGTDALSGVVGYHVYRGGVLIATTLTATFVDNGLTTDGSYTYTIATVDAAGNEAVPTSALTVMYDHTAPSAPSALIAASPTNAAPILSWTAATDATSGVASYQIYRGTTLVGSTAATTFTDAGITTSGSYAYAVKAVDRAGNVSPAANKSVSYDALPPSTPTGFAPAPYQATKPTMGWSPSTDTGGAGLQGYDVYRNGVLAGTTTTNSFSDPAALAEGAYLYTVTAVDKAGNASPPTSAKSITYDVTPPTAASGLASGGTPTNLKPSLSWTAGSDALSGVAGYHVYRNTVLVGTSVVPSFIDSGLSTDGVYNYTVATVDAAGNEGAPTGAVQVTYDKTAPPAPLSLTGTTPTASKPVLSWTTGGPDTLSGFSHYNVYRGGALIGTTASSSFTDGALSSSGSQSYTVKAVDNAGNVSGASPTKTIVYDVIAPPAPGTLTSPAATRVKPTLSWTTVTDTGGSGTASYNVYRDGVLIGSATSTTYTDSALVTDGSYDYSVTAVDNAGNEGPAVGPRTIVYDTTTPTTPGTPAGTTPTSAKPTITWTASTDVGGSGIASYTVTRNGTVIGTATSTTFTDAGLNANGSYDYAVRSVDAAGNPSAYTAPVTIVYDSVAPPIPTSLAGTTPTASKPVLSWSSGGPDLLSGFNHYNVYRGAAMIGTTASTTFTDAGLTTAGSMSYTVKSVDNAGNISGASLPATVLYDPNPPAAPTNPKAATPSRLPIVTWTAPTDASGIKRYDIYRNSSLIGSSATTSYTDAALSVDGTYSYSVLAVDNAGNSSIQSASVSVLYDGTPPPTPTALAGASPTKGKPAITWASGGGDNLSGFARYQVYRNGAPVTGAAGQPTSSGFVDSTISTNGTYTYSVSAIDNAGNESAPTSPITVVYDNTPPPTPLGLAATSPTSSAPSLTWYSGGADGLSGMADYEILRNGVVIGTSLTPDFIDAGLTTDGTYNYSVRAVDLAGNASASATSITVLYDGTAPSTPTSLSTTTPTRSSPTLSWTPSTDSGSGVVSYEVYRDGAPVGSTTTPSFIDDAPLADGVYSYTVTAVDMVGNESTPSVARAVQIDTTPPTSPSNLSGASPTNLADLSWTAATDAASGGTGIIGYNVYRGSTLVGTTSSTTFQDTTSPTDDAYDYTVTAVDGAGNESAASSPLSVLIDTDAPPVPISLTATTPTVAKPALSWSSGGPDTLSGFAYYEIDRNGTPVGTTTTTSFTDTGLNVNGQYAYTVRSVDNAGNRSNPSQGRSIVWDATAPSVPQNLTAATPSNLPTLRWSDASDTGGSGFWRYRVYCDGNLIGQTAQPAFVDTSSLAEGDHIYAVTAVDYAGNESGDSLSVTVAVDVSAPTVPQNVVAATPTTRPSLSWDPAIDTGTFPAGIKEYRVYRGASLVGTALGTSFTDDQIQVDGSFLYTVRAVDNAGNVSAPSAPVQVVFDHTPPPQPTRPLATSPTPYVPALTWSMSGVDNLSGFDHYDIYRDGELIAQQPSSSFVDASLAIQGAHQYWVRAVDMAGNASNPSAITTVVYDPTPPPQPTGLRVDSPTNLPRLQWDAVTDDDTGQSGVDHYNVYRDGSLVGAATTTSFVDSAVNLNGSYGYTVTAVDRAGNESLPSRTVTAVFDGTAPTTPLGLTAVSPTRLPFISWQPSSDAGTGDSAIASYQVYRDGAYLGDTQSPSWTDPTPTISGRYSYAVKAVDAAGNVSAASSPLEVVYDGDGPVLAAISFPLARSVLVPVAFTVSPHDDISGMQGQAIWDFGDGTAVGNSVQHVYHTAGVYQVSVRAYDRLGNLTTEQSHTIAITIPPGGVPPTYLRLGAIPTISVRALRASSGYVRVFANSDVTTRPEFIVLFRGAVIGVSRATVPAGGGVVRFRVPSGYRRAGPFSVIMRATNANLQARRSFSVVVR